MRITLSLALVVSCLITRGQTSKFDALLNRYHQEQNFNGAVVVATNGNVDFLSGIGLADREHAQKITPQSRFRIASMTKVFTAILIMKLYEQGKIDLNGTIGNYFPTYTGQGKDKVTIHQLLTYSSGIEDQAGPLGITPYQEEKTLDEFIEAYCSGKLVNTPGVKSVYGNTEYVILQKIIERAARKTYATFLTEIILSPLNMRKTGTVNAKESEKSLSKSYTYDTTRKLFAADTPYYVGNYFGAGNMYSTVEDMLILSNALFGYKILSESTTKKMLEVNTGLGYTAYGLWGSDGWGTFNEKFYYRTGGILGSTANWITTMNTHQTIIVLSNTDATNLYEISEQLYLLNKDQ